MKIALIGDMHLGYARFEEDSYKQAETAVQDAEKKADLIVLAGDVFDVKVPRMEVIEKAISIFKKIKKPIVAIHGNHDRRSRDMVNALEILQSAGVIEYLHNSTKEFEKDGSTINILGVGSIPSSYVKVGLENAMKNNPPKEGMFNILVIHQNINELIIGEEELSLDDIDDFPFQLVVNGHIHRKHIKLNGKLIIPGSTVVTQVRKGDDEPRGYILYNVVEKNHEFIEIPCRKIKIIKLEFQDAGIQEINSRIEETIKDLPKDQITRIILLGSIRDGITTGDINTPTRENMYINNKLNAQTLKEKLEQLKQSKEENISIKEFAMKKMKERTKDKVSFDSEELFNKLIQGVDKAEEYLEEITDT